MPALALFKNEALLLQVFVSHTNKASTLIKYYIREKLRMKNDVMCELALLRRRNTKKLVINICVMFASTDY